MTVTGGGRALVFVCIIAGSSCAMASWVGEPDELPPDWWRPVRQQDAPLAPPCDQLDLEATRASASRAAVQLHAGR